MAKSNDDKRKKSRIPSKLDYSKIPEDIIKAINKQQYTINKTTKLTWDGRQFLIRVPKEIAEEIGLKDDWHATFIYVKPLPEERDKNPKLEIKLER